MHFKWKIKRDGHKEIIPIFHPFVSEWISVMATKVLKHLQKRRPCWRWWGNSIEGMKLYCTKLPSLSSRGLQASLGWWPPPSRLHLCLHVASPLCPCLSSSVSYKDPAIGFWATPIQEWPHFQILHFTFAKTLFSSQVLFWDQGAPGLIPSRVSRGRSFLPLPASGGSGRPSLGWWLPPSRLCLCLHVTSPLCPCLCSSVSYKDPVPGFRAPLVQEDLISDLHSIPSAETPFPNSMPLWGSSWTWISEEP